MRTFFSVAALLAVTAVATGEISEKLRKKVETAEAVYKAAVEKADNARFYAVQKATGERLKVLRQAMSEATKGGDLEFANAIKGKIDAAEGHGGTRPKPKDTVKLGRHEYALIKEKATWNVAKRICEEMRGHLVTFESPAERDFCVAALKSVNAAGWIGASNESNLERYEWTTGAVVSEPFWTIDNGNQNTIAAAIVYWPPADGFTDHSLGEREFFICEWDD